MLTLAFAQIVWAVVFQWEALTGGSNGVLGIWPTAPFNTGWAYYLLVLALTVAGVLLMRRFLFSPFGYAMRAGRDSPLRAEATGIAVLKVHWLAFIIAGTLGGLAGALFAFAKGGISPETIHVARSIDALVMVLLGGIHDLAGPLVGAPVFTVLPSEPRSTSLNSISPPSSPRSVGNLYVLPGSTRNCRPPVRIIA
jgi:branched-chain amino acid transport system permease protein